MRHQVLPVHHVQRQSQAVPDAVGHGLSVCVVLRTPARRLEVESCEEMLSSLLVGLQIDAGDAQVVATPGEARAVPAQYEWIRS